MNDGTRNMMLTATEQKLITAIRDLPPSRLRDRVTRLMDDLAIFLQFPHCDGIQADGAPCDTADEDCDGCARLDAMLERMTVPGGD